MWAVTNVHMSQVPHPCCVGHKQPYGWHI